MNEEARIGADMPVILMERRRGSYFGVTPDLTEPEFLTGGSEEMPSHRGLLIV
ncbi:hypothetical protein K0M31_004941 [Melipona bicolor]|uniref:Uncharacterized protein n=1 Tax=Melipona bicolor TaxID=60889 RepID=A0AA40FWF0_9HYME|nr:hypothetical protein K0M31_004941 [Melipona bicolor]